MNKIFKRGLLAAALVMSMTANHAALTDGHFGISQIFDVQYNWSGTTLNASNFIAPYDMNFSHPTLASGQYFAFFDSTTNPGTYGMGVYNADGTLAQVTHNTGTLQAIGPDALFYIGSGFFGTVITTSAGYANGASASFTNMDTSVSAGDATGYTWASTTPLAAGETAGSTPSAPTLVSTAATTSLVSSSVSTGSTTNTTTVTRGTTVAVSTVTDTRDRQSKTLNINRNIVVTSTTPVTTTVVATTPVTTTTVTTPRNIETYSDSSTVTVLATPVTTTSVTNTVATTSVLVNEVVAVASNQQYATKIDQLDQLSSINERTNYSNLSDPLTRNKIINGIIHARNINKDTNTYLIGNQQNSNTVDDYSYKNNTFGVGVERKIKSNLLVGAQYVHNDVTLRGLAAAGAIAKDSVGIYALSTVNNWVVKGDYLYSNNELSWNHQLPALDLSNTGTTKGNDQTLAIRIYSPAFKDIRPFVGAQHTWSTRKYAQESGAALTAVDYSQIKANNGLQEVGIRGEHTFKQNWTAVAEISATTDKLYNGSVGLMYNAENKSVIIKLNQQQQNGVTSDKIELQARLSF